MSKESLAPFFGEFSSLSKKPTFVACQNYPIYGISLSLFWEISYSVQHAHEYQHQCFPFKTKVKCDINLFIYKYLCNDTPSINENSCSSFPHNDHNSKLYVTETMIKCELFVRLSQTASSCEISCQNHSPVK